MVAGRPERQDRHGTNPLVHPGDRTCAAPAPDPRPASGHEQTALPTTRRWTRCRARGRGAVMQSDRDVLQALFDGEPITRPELAARTGLSKPTVSGAIRRLQTAQLLRETGSRRGQPGRAPTC